MYRFDVNHGGFGLTRDIPPEFLQGTTLEEKHLVAQWVRTALAELQIPSSPRASLFSLIPRAEWKHLEDSLPRIRVKEMHLLILDM